MQFVWDPRKAVANLAKHRVSFELATHVWDDPHWVLTPDRVEQGEERWHAVGTVGAVTILVVVHAYPEAEDDGLVRIIGARKATPRERRLYEQGGIW